MSLQKKTSARLTPGTVTQIQIEYTAGALLLAHKSARKFRTAIPRLANSVSSEYFSGSLQERAVLGKIERACLLLNEFRIDQDLANEMLISQRNLQRLRGAAKASVQRKADRFYELILQRHAVIEA